MIDIVSRWAMSLVSLSKQQRQMEEEMRSRGEKKHRNSSTIKSKMMANNSCGRLEYRQVAVNSPPFAVCNKGGISCLESSALKIILICAAVRLKKQFLEVDPNRNLGSENCFLPFSSCKL